jgi:hypothetical protein
MQKQLNNKLDWGKSIVLSFICLPHSSEPWSRFVYGGLAWSQGLLQEEPNMTNNAPEKVSAGVKTNRKRF